MTYCSCPFCGGGRTFPVTRWTSLIVAWSVPVPKIRWMSPNVDSIVASESPATTRTPCTSFLNAGSQLGSTLSPRSSAILRWPVSNELSWIESFIPSYIIKSTSDSNDVKNKTKTRTLVMPNWEKAIATPTAGIVLGSRPSARAFALCSAISLRVSVAWVVVVIKGTTWDNCTRKASTLSLIVKKTRVSKRLGKPVLNRGDVSHLCSPK